MTVRDAVERAQSGAAVAIVGPHAHRLVAEAQEIALASGRAVTVSRANGRERIAFSNGGRLTFHRITTSVRGLSLDAAYITSMDCLAWAEHLDPCFGTKPKRVGVLI